MDDLQTRLRSKPPRLRRSNARFSRRCFVAALLIASTIGCGCTESSPPSEPKRRVERKGGYSFVPPRQWAAHKVSGVDFPVYLGLGDNPPAIQFRRDLSLPDDADAAEYVKEKCLHVYPASELLETTDFATASGLKGKRLVFEHETLKEDEPAVIRQIIYIFPNGGDTHAFWGSAPSEDGTQHDHEFDACAKSYRIEPKT